ncbi:MAG: PKD domain-containing protein [Candidatus Thalassarchaeaceae archaeon]
MGLQAGKAVSLSTILLFITLAGCTGLASTTPIAEITADQESINVGETVNFDARDSTTPSPTIIDEYVWDFGDGEKKTTTTGIAFHTFSQSGNHNVEVEVINDKGESDKATVNIFVNSPPTIVIEKPGFVRTNETATIDASNSYDVEGGNVEFIWDLDLTFDRNGDGDPTNDADSTSSSVEVMYSDSGNQTGSLTVVDDNGATSTEIWSLMVIERLFNVVWEEQHVTYEWSGYTEQGESTIHEHIPAQIGADEYGARIMQVNASLVLDRDLLPIQWPEDNFTLRLNVPETGWTTNSQTSHDNITLNATANIDRGDLNPWPASGYSVSADSSESLVQSLLNEGGARFGKGDWIWVITADECDPDFLIDDVDPDSGNDWTLTVDYILLIPRVSEVSV